jgi:hypothetical protein
MVTSHVLCCGNNGAASLFPISIVLMGMSLREGLIRGRLLRRHLIGGALVRFHEIEQVPAPVAGNLVFFDVHSGARH